LGKGIKEYLVRLKISDIFYAPNILAVFITDPYDKSGGSLFRYLRLNLIMPENSLVLSIHIEDEPYVSLPKRFIITKIKQNVFRLQIHYGFMELINIPQTIVELNNLQLCPINIAKKNIIYLIEHTHLTTTKRKATLPFFGKKNYLLFFCITLI